MRKKSIKVPDINIEASVVSAKNVFKTYRSGDLSVPALRGVNLDIQAGEFVAVVGPSGNGKSTLLNCLSGIDTIDSGSVEIAGHDIFKVRDSKRTALRASLMGFIFQSFNLIPVFNAVENVEMPLLATGVKPAIARKKAIKMLNQVEIGHRWAHRPSELSGGEQQRVAIARALVPEPSIIWADEPTGNLDSVTADLIVDLLKEVNSKGQTVVVVTHDRSIAADAQRVVQVKDGLIASDQIQTDGIKKLVDSTSEV